MTRRTIALAALGAAFLALGVPAVAGVAETSTPTPGATATQRTATPQPTTPGGTSVPSPTTTPAGSPVPQPSPTGAVTVGPTPSATAISTAVPTSTGTRTPTPTPTDTATTGTTTATPTPTRTPPALRSDVDLTETFENSTEEWVASPPFVGFTQPVAAHITGGTEGGALRLTTSTNTDSFGFWASPTYQVIPSQNDLGPNIIEVPSIPDDNVFEAQFVVSSSVESRLAAPQIRLRSATSQNGQDTVLVIESTNDAAVSPSSTETRVYTLTFTLPGQEPGFSLAFDVLNATGLDQADAAVTLQEVRVAYLGTEPVDSAQVVKRYTFDPGQEGWTSQSIPGVFREPFFRYGTGNTSGRLEIEATTTLGDETVFGWWAGPESGSDRVALDPDLNYFVEAVVGTTVAEADRVPSFRVRVNESFFRVSQFTKINSTGLSLLVPRPGQDRLYRTFLPPGYGAGDAHLVMSFDHVATPGDDLEVGGTIYLEEFTVFSYERTQ